MNTYIIKTFFLCTIFLSHSLFAGGYSDAGLFKGKLTVKGAFSTEGALVTDPATITTLSPSLHTKETDAKSSGAFSVEYVLPHSSHIEWGLGLSYQLPRTLKGETKTFNFIPLYSVLKVTPYKGKVSPYFIGQLGYNATSGSTDKLYELKGGLYYGLGLGISLFNNVQVEALYAVNTGTASFRKALSGKKQYLDIDYSKLSLSLGYSF